jgi:hypothetical protein
MARSKSEVATDTLRKLGILSAVDTPSAEDSSFVEARYDDKLDELRDKGLVYWTHTSRTSADIPNSVFAAIVNIMVEELATHYRAAIPTVTDDHGRPVSIGTKGMRDLRRHMAKGPSGEPTRALYY